MLGKHGGMLFDHVQVNSAASKDTLKRAFRRLNKPQDSEYSAETLEARTHLLKAALDVLSDSAGRRIYDNAVQSGSYEAREKCSAPRLTCHMFGCQT